MTALASRPVYACASCSWAGPINRDGRRTFQCPACGTRQSFRAPLPPAPAPAAPRIAFDLDGTLFDSAPGTDYESWESVRRGTSPHQRAIDTVRKLRDAGYRIAYVTGRCTHLRGLTFTQLLRARLPAGPLVLQEKWQGYAAMSHYKANAIRRLGAVAYVGDHEADRHAATLAQVAFFDALDLRAGKLPLPAQVVSASG